jgi:phosphopantetheinyl transferase
MNIYLTLSETPLSPAAQREAALRLLDHALLHEFGVALRPEIARTPSGKPYFVNSPLHFSYAHCSRAVVCAVASENIGVDVQPITAPKPAVIRRVCCDNELELVKLPPCEQSSQHCSSSLAFTRIWVQKEAYSKFTGRGLSEGFKSIDTTKFPPNGVLKHDNLCIACYRQNPIVNCQLSIVNC